MVRYTQQLKTGTVSLTKIFFLSFLFLILYFNTYVHIRTHIHNNLPVETIIFIEAWEMKKKCWALSKKSHWNWFKQVQKSYIPMWCLPIVVDGIKMMRLQETFNLHCFLSIFDPYSIMRRLLKGCGYLCGNHHCYFFNTNVLNVIIDSRKHNCHWMYIKRSWPTWRIINMTSKKIVRLVSWISVQLGLPMKLSLRYYESHLISSTG